MSVPDDRQLDENVSRLLEGEPPRPALPSDVEAEILRALKAKQSELYDKKEQVMDRSIAPPAQQQWAVIALSFAGMIGLAAVALLTGPLQPTQVAEIGESLEVPRAEIESRGVGRQTLRDGSILISHREAKVSVDGPRRLTLEAGEIYLIVAKSDRPFVVSTGSGEVSATGTRFAVTVDKTTRAAVAQGTVKLANAAGEIELHPGQQGTLQEDRPPTRGPAPRLSHLVSWAKEVLSQDERLVDVEESRNGLIAVDPSGQEARLALRKYHVDVHIEDGIARTTIDQTFFNHYPWNTEGTFYFPLPPDASVSRLAMYVGGKLNEGGMVERGYGQQVYNDIRYQWRDPALLEMMEGNVFKMRIFPLEGRQEKRIFLSYTQRVEELYGVQRYWLPMDHTHSSAERLSMRVFIKNGSGAFEPRSSTHDLEVTSRGEDLLLEYSTEAEKPDSDLILHLVPKGQIRTARATTIERDGEHFLFGRFSPHLPGQVVARPRQWIVLNDVSGSRTSVEIKAQHYIVERLVQEADDDDSLVVINLNTGANVVREEFVAMKQLRERRADLFTPPQTEEDHAAYESLGGTNMRAGFKAVADLLDKYKPDNPHVLYLGDGVATDGDTEIMTLVRAIPKSTFIGIGVGKKVDARFLRAAADRTNGMVTTINPNEDIDWRVFDLVAALNTPRLTGVSVELLDRNGRLLEAEAYPSARALAAGETLSIVARSSRRPAQVNVRGKIGSKPWAMQHSIVDAERDGGYIPRFWATRHLDELLKSGPEHKQEIVRLSKQYYVVTPHTSLIVLEDDAMYAKYKVERGRKDHWALYPAPKEIEVVKEPVDWHDWGSPGRDAGIEAKTEPKSVQDVVDSVQFRVNAPFYYWRPQPDQHGRYLLYHLLDDRSDATQLLMYVFAVAAEDGDAMQSLQSGPSNAASGATSVPSQGGTELMSLLPASSLVAPAASLYRRWHSIAPRTPVVDLFNRETLSPQFMPIVAGPMQLPSKLRELRTLLDDSRSMATPILQSASKRFAPAMELPVGNTLGSVAASGLSPKLTEALQSALAIRQQRMNNDIRNFNRQYGFWDADGWNVRRWSVRTSLDARRSNVGEISEFLDVSQLLSGDIVESLRTTPRATLFGGARNVKVLPLATAIAVGAYGPELKAEPGSCGVLAADHLASRRKQLLTQPVTPETKTELARIENALSNYEKAATRLENSDSFWNDQSWSHRPKSWTFQHPTVQVYPNYNWSYDLTRYAPALYTNSLDVLSEVVAQFPPADSKESVGRDARQQIKSARESIRPVKIRFSQDGPEVLAASGDRFAVTTRTKMYLQERMICDGADLFHIYDELGLAARRTANAERRASLRRMTPHLIEPTEALAKRFSIELSEKDADGFLLRLTPLSPKDKQKSNVHLDLSVLADGRIRHWKAFVGDQPNWTVSFRYGDGKVTASWLDKSGEQRAAASYFVEPLKEVAECFDADLSQLVVIDMPLMKPSYYEQLLARPDQEVAKQIQWKRSLTLASIQDFHWRRWGGANPTAQKAMNEAFSLIRQAGGEVKLGDLTLIGSAGARVINGDKQFKDSHPVARYFAMRGSWANAQQLRDENPLGLTGQLAAYHAAVQSSSVNEDYRHYVKHYENSPLVLAAAHHCSQRSQRPEAWGELYERSGWQEIAFLMSARTIKSDEQRIRLATSFEKWQREMFKAGNEVLVTGEVAALLKATKTWRPILQARFDRASKSKRLAPLLRFAEEAMLWGEDQWADKALAMANEQLDDTLLGRLAMAQALWAGGRSSSAMKLYEGILKSLEQEKIAPSPALLASAARLAEHAGDHEQAIAFEERALELEHQHLPELINVTTFRARYQLLWRQYQAGLQAAIKNKDEAAGNDYLRRAESAWRRWYEVDHDNFTLFSKMATLQADAGREERAWLYLSTAIDRRPKDAESYSVVSQWRRSRNDLDEAQQWLAQAFQWDTANPRWLLERGSLLKQMGRKSEARQLFLQVVHGKWAPGLQNFVEQAKQELK